MVKKIPQDELRARVIEERDTAKKYASEGFLSESRDEARHAKKFEQLLYLWYGEKI